ncbi:ABC transporter ATP-binding protein [Paenibacillus sp. 7516]|uniref:ABC transporter ATP-binding protein n=1 Tax=Paenibacillus sp. 7516 TaxID=2022549 RepID=UPI001BAE74A0|nr:ABC transporter ATP-binding protein [Paenibacillus sp. 7516]
MNAIEIKNVSMKYLIGSEKIDSLKYFFIKRVKKQIVYKEFCALNDVSFTVSKGEVFGIIGLNGAGKSTLMKVISGILKPTSGKVIKHGTIAPLIELGAGFIGDLSGYENIVLNGMILGYPKKMIERKIDEIIEFSEMEKFIHTPLKNYSSGMKARLGFAIATVVQPEILIVDEALSVGDIGFQEKSLNKIKNMIKNGTTVLFVSHSIGQIEEICSRVLWLENGMVRGIGDSPTICGQFKKSYQEGK